MEQPQFIKCEPDWLSDSRESYNLESNEEAASDKIVEVKCEPADMFSYAKIENSAEELIKQEHELQDVKEEAQNEGCISDGSPCWFQPLPTGVVEKEMSNFDEHHLKEISESNRTGKDSSVVGPMAPLLPDGLTEPQVSDNTCSTEAILKKHEPPSSLPLVCSFLTVDNKKLGSFVSRAKHCVSEQKCTSHLFEIIGKNVYYCKICDYRAFPCSMCDKYFINKSSMYRHQMKHSQDNWLCCNSCGKAFNDNSNLDRHMLSHGQNKIYECTTCGKAFSPRFQLKNHVMIHNRERPFSCHNCNEGFTRKSTLKSHIRTDTGVKAFKCTKCNRAFGKLHSLRKHLLAHSKQLPPCICTICGKTFTKRQYLKAHAHVHEHKVSLLCDKCGKSFINKSCLKRHILRHTAKLCS